MRRLTSFVALMVALILILFQTDRSASELIHVVSPSAYADTEGTAGGNAANPIGRYQQVFPASDFHSLPGIGAITQFANRPDGTMTTPFDGMYGSNCQALDHIGQSWKPQHDIR